VGALAVIRYEVPAWGVGELMLRHGVLLAHDVPNRRRGPAPAPAEEDAAATAGLVRRLGGYFAGVHDTFTDLDLDPTLAELGTTPFEARIIEAIRAIPYGETRSYRDVAATAGAPRAARAAGNVCAHGTLELIVPYHRVIASDGTIGSYGSDGIGVKRRLLALEGVRR
jgi:methylated-DNA-[protein]-cysteine S-methyltransferase